MPIKIGVFSFMELFPPTGVFPCERTKNRAFARKKEE
jgi:hypothetical protein